LAETVEELCSTEKDHDAFAVKVSGPQAVLDSMLARDEQWVPDIQTTFGAQATPLLLVP